ncbi:MAG: hypothetical protein ABI374_09780 [Ginsengibacter sp.]
MKKPIKENGSNGKESGLKNNKCIMAEEEKIKEHAKKAVLALSNKENSWKKKITGFLFEILIIIVAVSITLWFHNLNDQRHDREMEKNFLIGIRDDLKQDTATLKYVNLFLQTPLAYYDNVLKQINENKIDARYVDTNSVQLINDLYFNYNNGLFESFKSSGNLRVIKNQKLLSDITGLYTDALPFQQESDKHILDNRALEYGEYIGSKYGIDSSWNTHISNHLNDPDVRFQIQKNDIDLKEMVRHHKQLISEINDVNDEIDKELKDRF